MYVESSTLFVFVHVSHTYEYFNVFSMSNQYRVSLYPFSNHAFQPYSEDSYVLMVCVLTNALIHRKLHLLA